MGKSITGKTDGHTDDKHEVSDKGWCVRVNEVLTLKQMGEKERKKKQRPYIGLI